MAEAVVTLRIVGDNGQVVGTLRTTSEALKGVSENAQQAGTKGAAGLQKMQKQADLTEKSISSAKRQVLALLASIASFQTIRVFGSMADELNLINARLNIVTKSEERYGIAQRQTFEIAQATRTGLGVTAELYGRLQRATDDLGRSQTVALSVTDTINKTFKVSGASAQSTTASIIQLSQALAAGALRGDEFNSVNEQAPRLMEAIAASLKITRGELKELGGQGALTADIIIDALEDQKEAIEREFKQLPKTIEDSFTQLRNVVLLAVGEVDKGGQISARTAEAISGLTDEVLRLVQSGALRELGEDIAAIARHMDVLLVGIGSLIGARGIGALVTRLRAATLTGGALFAAMGGWVTVVAALATGIYLLATRETEATEAARLLDDATRTLSLSQGAAKESAIGAAKSARNTAAALLEQAQAALTAAQANAALAQSAPRDIGPGENAFRAGQSLGSQLVISSLLNDVQELSASLAKADNQLAESTGLADKFRAKMTELTGPLRLVAQSLGLVDRAAAPIKPTIKGVGDATKDYAQDLKLGASTAEQWIAALEKQSDALSVLDELIGDSAQTLSGPMLDALEDNAKAQDKLTKATETLYALGPPVVEIQELIAEAYDAVTAAAGRRIAAAEREQDSAANIQAFYEREIQLASLTVEQRRIELAAERALGVERELWNGNLSAAQEEQIVRLARVGEANLIMAERAREAADTAVNEAVRIGSAITDNIGGAVADVIFDFDSLDDVLKDLSKSMLDEVKNLVAQMISQFLKLKVLKPILESVFNGVGGGAFDFGSLLGVGGGTGGGLGSLFGGGASSGGGLLGLLGIGGSAGAGTATGIAGGSAAAAGFTVPGTAATTGSGGFGALGGAAGVAAIIAVAMMVNDSLYGQGWRATRSSTTLPNGQRVTGGGSVAAREVQRSFDPLGVLPDRWGSILSGSATVARLFGHSAPRLTDGQTTFRFGSGGVTGGERYRTHQEGGFFRRDRNRWHESGLGAENQAYGDDVFAGLRSQIDQSLAMLGSDAEVNFQAAMRVIQKFGKKGEVEATEIWVDVLGTAFKVASEDEAIARLGAEAVIASIDASRGGMAEAIEATLQAANEQIAGRGGSIGRDLGERFSIKLAEGAGQAIEDAPGEVFQSTRGEASAIAQRWRHDTELLVEGAQFLLRAASDANAGLALLGPGSTLTEIADLTEDLQQAGEPLLATYQRMVAATRLLDDALALSGITLNKTREDVVRFATDIAEAAGGIDRAQQLWSRYFQVFFSAQERAALALEQGRSYANTQFGDIGLNLNDFTGDGGTQAFRDLFEAALPTLSAEAVVEWLEAADALGVVIDLTAQYAAALGDQADTLDVLMSGIQARIADLEPEEQLGFKERIAAINADTDALLARAIELNATEDQLQQIRYLGQLQLNEVIAEQNAAMEQQAAAMADYRAEVQSIADLIAERGMTEFQIELRDINRWGADAAESLHAAARAAGLESAAAQDLALVHEEVAFRVAAAIGRLRDRGRELVAQLQGTPLSRIEDQIQILQSAQQAYVNSALGGLEQITQASDNAYNAQLNAQLRIREFLDNLLLSPLGGLRPRDALAEAQAQFDALLQLALGGDVEAQAALPALAQQLLQLGQQVYASGDPYFALRDSIIAALEQVAALPVAEPGPTGGGPGTGGGPVEVGASPELQALYEERDRLLAEQTAAQQLAVAQEITAIIRELVLATGDPLSQIAADLGVNLTELVTALGVNLDDLTVSTASQLADVAQAMGVNLADLAEQVGVELGQLADAQSLLNDALEAEINSLPAEQANLLRPLLAQVEAAAALGDAAGTEAALAVLEGAVNELAPDIRDALAPYFTNVDPATYNELTALSAIDISTAAALPLLGDILANIRESNIAAGIPSYAVGTSYVPRTGLAMLHQAEMVLPAPVADFYRREGIPTPSAGLRNDVVADEIRQLREERKRADAAIDRRLQALETATTGAGDKQARAINDQTNTIKRAAR